MNNYNRNRSGVVLLITLVVLVVLSMLGYMLTSRVTAYRLRNQYLIDYSKARYSCDSALKYTLETLEEIDPQLISRWDVPDFSDLFYLDSSQYEEMIEQWKLESQYEDFKSESFLSNIFDSNDANDTNLGQNYGAVSIPGPYGAPWPMITEPAEFDIGDVKVWIEIEDENAKYPLGWGMLEDKEQQREIDAGFELFCEMSGLDSEGISNLREDLSEIRKIKRFKVQFEPIVTTTRETVRTTSSSTRSSGSTTSQVKRTVLTEAKQISDQTTSFAKFFNSSLLNRDALAKPTIVDGDRKESPLKYISTWGTRLINVNTAPRHVLEAAFIFGGNQVEIAQQIIEERRDEPFKDIEDLMKRVIGYSDAIEKCKPYITTKSTFFTIRITALSGKAKATSLIAITKEPGIIKRIAIING